MHAHTWHVHEKACSLPWQACVLVEMPPSSLPLDHPDKVLLPFVCAEGRGCIRHLFHGPLPHEVDLSEELAVYWPSKLRSQMLLPSPLFLPIRMFSHNRRRMRRRKSQRHLDARPSGMSFRHLVPSDEDSDIDCLAILMPTDRYTTFRFKGIFAA